jgi:hypothetical protein
VLATPVCSLLRLLYLLLVLPCLLFFLPYLGTGLVVRFLGFSFQRSAVGFQQ